MSEAIVVAIITGGITLLGAILSGAHSSKLTIFRIEQLEKKVEKHNNIVERMAKAEERAKSNTHRLDDGGL